MLGGCVLLVACASSEPPPPPALTEVDVGVHRLAFAVPDGWLHFDHGREQRFEREILRLSIEDLGPVDGPAFARALEADPELPLAHKYLAHLEAEGFRIVALKRLRLSSEQAKTSLAEARKQEEDITTYLVDHKLSTEKDISHVCSRNFGINRIGSVPHTPASTGVLFTTGSTSLAISITIALASP